MLMVEKDSNKKLIFSIDEKECEKKEVDIEKLMSTLSEDIDRIYSEKEISETENMDNYIALETDYELNYVLQELHHIAKYYDISIRKKKKGEIIQDIVLYEMEPNNMVIVSRRHYLWECLEQIKGDEYLSKFLNGI